MYSNEINYYYLSKNIIKINDRNTGTEFAISPLVNGFGDREQPGHRHCFCKVCRTRKVQMRVPTRALFEQAASSVKVL